MPDITGVCHRRTNNVDCGTSRTHNIDFDGNDRRVYTVYNELPIRNDDVLVRVPFGMDVWALVAQVLLCKFDY